jgi:hypothetical protein
MATIVGQQPVSVTFRVWNRLAEPRAQVAIALAGSVAAIGGGLLLATSDHLVDPVDFGLQVAITISGTVADDGVGCDPTSARRAGTGFASMNDRVAALGGTLTVDSASGRGTRLRGRVPLR